MKQELLTSTLDLTEVNNLIAIVAKNRLKVFNKAN